MQKSVAIVIGVLILLFLLLLTLSIYVHTKYYYRSIPNPLTPQYSFQQLLRSRSSLSGIDKTVIKSIPFFTFSSLKGSKQGLECSVCLSVFEGSDLLRLLPKCKHVFHMCCIDEWLENHSTCPLCRYKFDSAEFMSYTYTSSLGYSGNPSPSNLMNSPNLELFVEREEERRECRRFSFGDSFRKLIKSRNEDCLEKKFHKFKHNIVVSDVFDKRRWSDLNSSDLMLLSSEMLGDMSRKGFDSNSSKHCSSLSEQLMKIKEDIERNMILETRKVRSDSSALNPLERDENIGSRLIKSTDKRSMSEITILTRFKDSQVPSNRYTESSSSRDEKIKKLWVPIAKQTLQLLENNLNDTDMKIHTSNV